MAILTAMLSGGERRPKDFYPTPRSATVALLPFIQSWGPIWEPCCGDGAISKVLQEGGFSTIDQDLYDYDYGTPGINFFSKKEKESNSIITNPPFVYAEPFISHANKLKVDRMALILKSTYWSAAKRIKLWRQWQPCLILALTWRLDFTGAGAPHTDCIWCLWDRAAKPGTQFELLERP